MVGGADSQFMVVWGKLRGTGYSRDRLLGFFCGIEDELPPTAYTRDPSALHDRQDRPRRRGGPVGQAAGRRDVADADAAPYAVRLDQRDVRADSTRSCDVCRRQILSGETQWRCSNLDLDCCEACLAAARLVDTRSTCASHRTSRLRRAAPAAQNRAGSVVPHDDRERQALPGALGGQEHRGDTRQQRRVHLPRQRLQAQAGGPARNIRLARQHLPGAQGCRGRAQRAHAHLD
jgi:hypothetical protein